MRVITGTARGRVLKTPDGLDVRPTVSKVKEGIFSALQFEIEGRRVLDLFAGSGQLGIESLSRGAKCATFVDSSAKSLSCINDNITACGLNANAKVVSSDSIAFLSRCTDVFDIAFLDPPYKHGLIDKAMPLLENVMSEFGIIVCEHASDEPLSDVYGSFKLKKDYRYGTVTVSVYNKA